MEQAIASAAVETARDALLRKQARIERFHFPLGKAFEPGANGIEAGDNRFGAFPFGGLHEGAMLRPASRGIARMAHGSARCVVPGEPDGRGNAKNERSLDVNTPCLEEVACRSPSLHVDRPALAGHTDVAGAYGSIVGAEVGLAIRPKNEPLNTQSSAIRPGSVVWREFASWESEAKC